MSDKSAKLLLRVAAIVEAHDIPLRKQECVVSVPLDVSLCCDIMQWSRGYKEMLRLKPKKPWSPPKEEQL